MRLTHDEVRFNGRLALDEQRRPFSPILWTNSNNYGPDRMKQVWFPGVHASVGGGGKGSGLAAIALAWMVSKVEINTSLKFLRGDVYSAGTMNAECQKCEWGCSPYTDSLKGKYRFTGRTLRTPKEYGDGTNEYLHQSVTARQQNNRGEYNPPGIDMLEPDAQFGEIEDMLRSSWTEIHAAANLGTNVRTTSTSSLLP